MFSINNLMALVITHSLLLAQKSNIAQVVARSLAAATSTTTTKVSNQIMAMAWLNETPLTARAAFFATVEGAQRVGQAGNDARHSMAGVLIESYVATAMMTMAFSIMAQSVRAMDDSRR